MLSAIRSRIESGRFYTIFIFLSLAFHTQNSHKFQSSSSGGAVGFKSNS